MVGVNKFQKKEAPPTGLLRVNPEVEAAQRDKLTKDKASRDNGRVAASLKSLKEAARSDENLMPSILESVRCYATLGEICGVLREEFGEYQPKTVV